MSHWFDPRYSTGSAWIPIRPKSSAASPSGQPQRIYRDKATTIQAECREPMPEPATDGYSNNAGYPLDRLRSAYAIGDPTRHIATWRFPHDAKVVADSHLQELRAKSGAHRSRASQVLLQQLLEPIRCLGIPMPKADSFFRGCKDMWSSKFIAVDCDFFFRLCLHSVEPARTKQAECYQPEQQERSRRLELRSLEPRGIRGHHE